MAKLSDGSSLKPQTVDVYLTGDELHILGDPQETFKLSDVVVSYQTREEIHLRKGMTFLELTPEDASFSAVAEKLKALHRAHQRKAISLSFVIMMGLGLSFVVLPRIAHFLPDRFFAWILPGKQLVQLMGGCEIDQRVSQQLLQSGGVTENFKLGIVKFPQKNAFAVGADRILLTEDLVKSFRHEDELMAVIGHEVGHLQKKHYKSGIVRYLFIDVITSIFENKVINLAYSVILNSYSQEQELEADKSAVSFLRTSGYSIEGAVSLMDLLEKDSGEKSWYSFLQSHPEASERKKFFKAQGSSPELRPLSQGKILLEACKG